MESTVLPLDDPIEERKRRGKSKCEYEMPPVPKPSFAYRVSQATSLGKRKRNTKETLGRQGTPPPDYTPGFPQGINTTEDVRDVSQRPHRRRHSSIVDQVSGKFKEGWRWLRRDSGRFPETIDDLCKRASEERKRALPGADDAQARYEGRANIPSVTSFLDSSPVAGPSNFYDTPQYRKSQSNSPSSTHLGGSPVNSEEDDPFSAVSDPQNVPLSTDTSFLEESIFRHIRRHSQHCPDDTEISLRPLSWSSTNLFKRRGAKRRQKQPAQRPEGLSLTNVPMIPVDVPRLPVTMVTTRNPAPVATSPVFEIDSHSRWSSSDGSSNDFQTSFEIWPFDESPLRLCLNRILVGGQPEIDEHFLSSPGCSADFSRLMTTDVARPLSEPPLSHSTHSLDNSLSSDLRPNTGGGLTPNGRHMISRSTSQHQMTFPMSPVLSRHETTRTASSSRHSVANPSQASYDYPDSPFHTTRRQSAAVVPDGIATSKTTHAAPSTPKRRNVRMVTRSPSPTISRRTAAERNEVRNSWIANGSPPLDVSSRNSWARMGVTSAWWEEVRHMGDDVVKEYESSHF